MENSKNILIINDMPGYGKVALAAMLPILSNMGHSVYNLPTALVSNTLDYGKFTILDTTDYMVYHHRFSGFGGPGGHYPGLYRQPEEGGPAGHD